MPRIYKPTPGVGGRNRHSANVARSKMELGVRDDDPVQEMVSAANALFPGGTHRSPQCKDSARTPGPGAYRLLSTFPLSSADEAPGQAARRRAPSYRIRGRIKGRVADIGNPFAVVPPIVGAFQQQAGYEAQPTTRSRITINTMPPVSSSGKILQGHGGDVPKGYGLPF
eukprot:TRINITY_DN38189_c0_g1_i1.p1 TRINITY_DN38189_c0_g1~~TRINITY_DN38189_c0_g1_i1.p1  ORF type:complete len:169 (-),score=23.36 TRINITY_DN38189_c0_g1_i1:78-584(-)